MSLPITVKECILDSRDWETTSSRIASIAGRCSNVVQFLPKTKRDPMFANVTFYACYDSPCHSLPAAACMKESGDTVWFFAVDHSGRPELIHFTWKARVVESSSGIRLGGISDDEKFAGHTLDCGGRGVFVYPKVGIYPQKARFRILRTGIVDNDRTPVVIEIEARREGCLESPVRQKVVSFVANLAVDPKNHAGTASSEVVTGASIRLKDDAAWQIVDQTARVALSDFSVVGSFYRFDEVVRNRLRYIASSIRRALEVKTETLENYVIWAPPGSGKTFFISQLASHLSSIAEYFEINVAKMKQDQVATLVQEIRDCDRPRLVFIDEIDCENASAWSCELVFALLQLNSDRPDEASRVVVVLAGSTANSVETMLQKLAGFENKGKDLVSRLGREDHYRLAIPMPCDGDRIVIFVAALQKELGELRSRSVGQVNSRMPSLRAIHRFALYYLLSDKALVGPRAIGDLATHVVGRIVHDNREVVYYDDMFEAGQSPKQFFLKEHFEAFESLNERETILVE